MTPEPASPLTPSQRRELAIARQLGATSCLVHTIVQLMHLKCPWSERWQRLLSIPVTGLGWAVPALAPHFYLRRRHWFTFAHRVAFFMFPLLRKPKGIQRVLDTGASPGGVGALKDVLKIAWGERAAVPWAKGPASAASYPSLGSRRCSAQWLAWPDGCSGVSY